MPTNSKRKKSSIKSRKPAFNRGTAKRIAGRKMYAHDGNLIRNLDAYLNAGGQAYNSADPKYLYHYTTPQAASSIAESSQITGSSVGLAGSGTYLTAKPPRTRTNDLLQNNCASTTVRDSSYVDQYVRVEADDLGARHVGEDRDVWRVNGNVDLLSYNGFVAARSPKRSRRSTGTQPFEKEYADGLH